LLIILHSCGQHKPSPILSQNNPILDGKKLVLPDLNLKTNELQAIKIERAALKHRFLMTAANMGGSNTDQGPFSFESKVVYFELKDQDHINLFEQTESLDSNNHEIKLLASFPIVEKNHDSLVFDFDLGMKHIYQKRNTLSYNNQLNQEHTLKIVDSFLYQAEVINRHLMIKHHVKIQQTTPDGNIIYDQINMKYTFSSYVKSQTFVAKNHPDRSLFAFYETHTKKQSSKVIRMNHVRPVTFYYTGNIPAEYLNAVIVGINYWNQLLGVDFIEIKKLPEHGEAFDPGLHIIEWSTDNRNYAYTSVQNDPFTGEILQTYINFPNPLNSPQYQLIGEYLKKHARQTGPQLTSTPSVTIKQFHPNIISHHETENNSQMKQSAFNNLLQTLPGQWQTDKIYKKIFSDLISTLIAHEVGHALGIKHNFAGSVGATLSHNNKKEIYYNYIFHDQLDAQMVTTASVMDYLPFTFLALTGAQIRKGQLHFSWDQLMLKWLYSDQADFSDLGRPLFCSDQDHDLKKWINCKSFDSFQNPISGAISTFEDHFQILSFEIAQKILSLGPQTLHLLPASKLSSLLAARRTGAELFQSYQSITDHLLSKTSFIHTDNAKIFQQTSLTEANQTLKDLLITPFSYQNQPIIHLILKLKKIVIKQIIFINRENNFNLELDFLPKLDTYFNDIEEVFLNYYFTYLNQSTFQALFSGQPEEHDFFKAMEILVASHLFTPGKQPIDLSYTYFYPKLYQFDASFNDSRRLIVTFLLHNPFTNEASLPVLQQHLRFNIYKLLQEHISHLENLEISPADPFRYNEYLQTEYGLLEILKNEI